VTVINLDKKGSVVLYPGGTHITDTRKSLLYNKTWVASAGKFENFFIAILIAIDPKICWLFFSQERLSMMNNDKTEGVKLFLTLLITAPSRHR
jgi:hypothetical protein